MNREQQMYDAEQKLLEYIQKDNYSAASDILREFPNLKKEALVKTLWLNRYTPTAKRLLDKYLTRENAIDIIVAASNPYQRILPEGAYEYLDERKMHPSWFNRYLGYYVPEPDDPITDHLFWRKIATAAIYNNNIDVLDIVLATHSDKGDLTREMIDNIISLAKRRNMPEVAEVASLYYPK